jgi:hypothetical protein
MFNMTPSLNMIMSHSVKGLLEEYGLTTMYYFIHIYFSDFDVKIPYCGHTQLSHLYTTKYRSYEYNIRNYVNVPNVAFVNFLEYYNVSRVALIYGSESSNSIGPAFQDSPYNIKEEILASKIQLLANIAVPYRLLNENDKNNTFVLLKSSDARYLHLGFFTKLYLNIRNVGTL